MSGSNPIMEATKKNAAYRDTNGYDSRRITITDIVSTTVISLCVVGVTALVVVWLGLNYDEGVASMASLAGSFGVLVCGIITAFRRYNGPVMMTIFSIAEGAMAGGVTFFIGDTEIAGSPGWSLVTQALVATIGMFIGCWALYASGFIRVSSKFRRFLFFALTGMSALYLGNFIISLFTGNNLLFSSGPIPIVIGLIAVVLAALSLISDFDTANFLVRGGAPESAKWEFSIGVMTSLVWMYIEILRLLFLFSNRD